MKKKKDYQFGNNQKKANNEGKDVLPSKEQIKKNLKEINTYCPISDAGLSSGAGRFRILAPIRELRSQKTPSA